MKRYLQALTLCALAGPLGAQDVGFAVQAGFLKPMDNLEGDAWSRGKGALTYGISVPIRISPSEVLVPRLDVWTRGAGAVMLLADDKITKQYLLQSKVETRSLGMDWDFYILGRPDEGAYLGVGLAAAQVRFSGTTFIGQELPNVVLPDAWPSHQTKVVPQYVLCAGCRFSEHFGAETRLTRSSVHGVGLPGTVVVATNLAFSLVCNF